MISTFISLVWLGGIFAMRDKKVGWFDSIIWPFHLGYNTVKQFVKEVK